MKIFWRMNLRFMDYRNLGLSQSFVIEVAAKRKAKIYRYRGAIDASRVISKPRKRRHIFLKTRELRVAVFAQQFHSRRPRPGRSAAAVANNRNSIKGNFDAPLEKRQCTFSGLNDARCC